MKILCFYKTKGSGSFVVMLSPSLGIIKLRFDCLYIQKQNNNLRLRQENTAQLMGCSHQMRAQGRHRRWLNVG